MKDSEIASLYAQGECRQAFNLIVREYSEPLYLHIRSITANHEDADDCLQNTFIKVWKSLDTFRWEASLYTWLYRIATNETISFLRRNRFREMISRVDPSDMVRADDSFNGDKLQLALQKAMAKLPPKQKAVFSMRYFQEMPYEKMSEILGTSQGALKASYHHAAEKIREWVLNFYEE